MSFWAATVITNLFSAIPIFGNDIVFLLWGNFTISNSTLNRFFSFHFLLPFLLLIFIILHFIFLHERGSANPLKVYFFTDKILFNPYYTLKDFFIVCSVLFFCIYLILINPNLLGHPDNYIQANPLVTPSHIVPEWYFLLFYAILRAVPSKLGGFLVLLFSIFILIFFPFFFKKFGIFFKKDYEYSKLFNK
jgi:ubiquinol-cytochrome c reductase cytochrome b subunit